MATGLTKDAGWEVGVSRTLPHAPRDVWDFVSGPEGVALWLGAGAELTAEAGAPYATDDGVSGEVRGYRPGEKIRVTYGDTTVQVAVRPAAGGRAMLRFHQERMSDAAGRERRRAHWQGVMDAVAAALDRRG